ncbi:MAG: hypothetical protein ACD_72C00407G0002 [uncultured bacterium]|nr:MAG: hypothetical protein ACD_72C00407G0002 [uncultured bacterium]
MEFQRNQLVTSNISPKRALVIYGPRRVGKTTSVKQFLSEIKDKKVKYDVGDDLALRKLFNGELRKDILDYARPYEVIVIDEAQQIEKVGLAIKMMIDEFLEKIIILTGSSSFDLAQNLGEPLTGRKFTLTLLPLAQAELLLSDYEKKNFLEDFLIFGAYPEVLSTYDRTVKIKILQELVASYLFKDILALDKLRSPELLLDITKCLAFQVGNEVSFNEIARTVGADIKKVQRYVDVLEKSFVIKRVRAFSRNLRNEISKKAKFYFYDNGVRNAVIDQFNPLTNRNDIGALWENFIFMELFKKSNLSGKMDSFYFWRNKTGAEIDIIIESNGNLEAVECKWSKSESKNLNIFLALYPRTKTLIINKNNYLDRLGLPINSMRT